MEMGRNALQRPHTALSQFSEKMHICEISHTAVPTVFTPGTIQHVAAMVVSRTPNTQPRIKSWGQVRLPCIPSHITMYSTKLMQR